MTVKDKEKYISPTCETIEIKSRGVLCASPQYNNPFGTEENW